jgi:hypothetical protein
MYSCRRPSSINSLAEKPNLPRKYYNDVSPCNGLNNRANAKGVACRKGGMSKRRISSGPKADNGRGAGNLQRGGMRAI